MVDRLVPGDGELPLVAILRRLLAGRPTLPVGVEVFSSRLRSMPTADAVRVAVAGTRSVLASV
jgi:sugar phosphate isomerase/epimerase